MLRNYELGKMVGTCSCMILWFGLSYANQFKYVILTSCYSFIISIICIIVIVDSFLFFSYFWVHCQN